MPLLAISLLGAAMIVQLVVSKVSTLQEAERSWDPRPKNLGDNEVVILYCTS